MRPRGPLYDAHRVTRAPRVALAGGERAIVVEHAMDGETVAIRVLASFEPSEDERDRALYAARGLAALDDDPTDFYAMVKGHALLGRLVRDRDVRMTRTPTVFEAFAEMVLGQLVTSQEARASKRRLWAHAGALVPGTDLRAAPTAREVMDVPPWKLREMGVGARRVSALREGAKRGDALERLREREPEDAMGALESLRGVGPWTSNGVAASALGYADAVPFGDLWVPRLVTEALGGGPDGDDETLLAVLAPFRPHRARVCRVLEEGAPRPDTEPPRRAPRVDRHRRMPWRY